MKNALSVFRPAFKELTKDKVNFLLTLIPILIGILIYYFLGSWLYGSVLTKGQELISSYVSEGGFGTVVYYIVAAVVSVLLFLLVNWTFVLVVSVIASPFNDLLSSRIEKTFLGKENRILSEAFNGFFSGIFGVVFNEIKKVSLILVLSIIAFLFGYIPLLAPVSLFITILLLAMGFIDYSWSRHDIRFRDCVKDVKSNLWGYSLGGVFFFVLVSIPIINLIVSPLATSYFTLLWLENNEYRSKITE